MNPNELRELAERVDGAESSGDWDSCELSAAYLREQADRMEQGAVAWLHREPSGEMWVADTPEEGKACPDCAPVYLHPAPQSVPAGYWLAPMEPTEAMLDAALAEWTDPPDTMQTREYRAMRDACIAASPAASVEERECETCGGVGTIDERLGGYGDSNPAARCPDCDGRGWWSHAAPAPDVVEALRELESLQIETMKNVWAESGHAENALRKRWAAAWGRARAALAAADQKEPTNG